MNFLLSAPSPFLHSGSFTGIEKKTNSQEPDNLIFSQVKCHLLYFVLIPGQKVPGPGEMVFELEELIVPQVYSLCFPFVPGEVAYMPGENVFGSRDLTCNLRELVLPHKKCCPSGHFLAFDVESPLLVQNFDFPV